MVESPVKNNCSDCIYFFLFLLFSVIERLQLKIEVLKAIIWGLLCENSGPCSNNSCSRSNNKCP